MSFILFHTYAHQPAVIVERPKEIGNTTNRRKAPFVDDPAAVVDESVRANVIAIVRPTSRGVIRLHDGENDERETACSREYQVLNTALLQIDSLENEARLTVVLHGQKSRCVSFKVKK